MGQIVQGLSASPKCFWGPEMWPVEFGVLNTEAT
jgi:hypothetical protein